MSDLSKPQRGSGQLRPGLARFVHQLTHDVRNDLAAVEVFAAAAAGSGDIALVRDALAEISASVAACGRRLAALRAAACLELPTPQMVRLGVESWMDGIRKHVERHPAAPFVTWHEPDDARGIVIADPAYLAFIIEELLTNALRFGGGASRKPPIEMHLKLVESWLQIRVSQPVMEVTAIEDWVSLDVAALREPMLSSTKHHYGFGLSAITLRAGALGADFSVLVEPSQGTEAQFTAVLKLPLMS